MPPTPKADKNVRANRLSMPGWITVWAVIGSLVCLWDATYVLTRPRSMANGDLFQYFSPYAKYITVDPLYGNLKNAFVIAQSCMNYIELSLTLLAVIFYHIFRRRNLGCLILLIASVMTWSKTVVYFIHDHFERSFHPEKTPVKVETWEHVCLFIIPSTFWIVLPFASMWNIGRQIIRIINLNNEKIKTK
jgi:hypothetical protein